MYVIGLAIGVVVLAGTGAHGGVDPWVPTAATAIGLILTRRHLIAPHAAFVAILSWCVITGLIPQGDAELSFGSSDLWRLTALGAAAAASGLSAARRRPSPRA
ncbi:hypothetical protein Cph01nite_29700 [Cellulomonas phragmiteti]|uniref:SPW repeat-containing protein n=1 Tax=Cellulomonas phragmiteti TaxID=478780 RepID=A0ABQ4DPE3_9CELL|nr:hypothetical protein Cph01nite_29700 [Cellulomonas phragmiteti]